MSTNVAVIAPGAMGSGVAARLTEHGVTVRTLLAGRSAETVARAHKAGMTDATEDEIAGCDIILSIVPPGEALGLAERLAPALRRASRKPLYVDCNAVDPGTVLRIAGVVEAAGGRFVDGGIIAPPPVPDSRNTRLYLSGAEAGAVAALGERGLSVVVQPGPVGAASAMKMSYAGITKGFTALGAAMMLAASRAGTVEPLLAEMKLSQPALLDWLTRQVPRMYPKAYRWVAEMEEIAAFVGEDPAARDYYLAAARFYERIAADDAGAGTETAAMDAFCGSARS